MKLEMKVIAEVSLRIRSGPGMSYPTVGYLFNGNTIIATEEKNGWYKHSRGWSYGLGKYLQIVKDLEGQVKQPTNVTPTINNKQNKTTTTNTNSNSNTSYNSTTSSITKNSYSVKTLDFMTEEMRKDLGALGWYDKRDIDIFNKMNRFGFKDYDQLQSAREYVFFTKPDLNIYQDTQGNSLNEDLKTDPLFNEIHRKCPEVLYQLQRSVTKNESPFMNLLYHTRASKVDLPTVTSKEIETSSTQFGTRLYYRKHSFESDENHDFSIEFRDRKTLLVYYLFKAWNHYSNLKSIGIVSPRDIYRTNMELHDQIAIYKIIVTEVGDEILYFAKITGCYPKTVPRDVFSDVSDKLTYNIQWKGNFVEDMDPLIIEEFNRLVNPYRQKRADLPLYDSKNYRVNSKWATVPYIQRQYYKGKSGFKYVLKWKE